MHRIQASYSDATGFPQSPINFPHTHLPFTNLPFLLNQIPDTSTVSSLPVPQTCCGARVGGVNRARSQASVTKHFLVLRECNESQVCPQLSQATPAHSLGSQIVSLSSILPLLPLSPLHPASSKGLGEASQRLTTEARRSSRLLPQKPRPENGWLSAVFPVIRKSHKGDSRGTLSCQGG